MPVTRIALACAAAVLAASGAGAQTSVAFVPSLSIGGIYDDNVFARVEGSTGQMLQVRPSFQTSVESPRVAFLSVVSFDMMRSNHPELTTVDARRHALVDARIRTTPETAVALGARYDRTETPGEINIESGLLSDRRQGQRLQFTPSFTHQIGPRTTINGGYDWTTENLVDTERGTQHSARTGLEREVSTRTTLTAGYLGRYFVEGADAQMSHALLAGWNRELSAATRVALQAGPRMTSYTGLTAEIVATLARTTNRLGIALDYWHGEALVLGVHGPVAVNSATARFTWPVRRTTEFAAITGVSDLTSLDRREARVYRGTVLSSWTPRDMLTFAASYGLDYQLGDIRYVAYANQNVLRHVFRVSMTIAPRLTRSILPPDEAARARGVLR